MTHSMSLSDISDQFLEYQARVDNGEIMTEVGDFQIYPFEKKWWIRLDLEEPFEDMFGRVNLGRSKDEIIDTLFTLLDKPSVSSMACETISINLNAEHKINDNAEKENIERPAIINGNKGYISKQLPKYQEYLFEQNHHVKSVQSSIQGNLELYNLFDQNELPIEAYIDKVSLIRNEEVILTLSLLNCDTNLLLSLHLPTLDNIEQNPVTRFIREVGCGKIEELQNEYVYIDKNNKSDSIVGSDLFFDRYGVCSTPAETEQSSQTILSKLFNRNSE